MCLSISILDENPLIAQEDIPCYKIVRYVGKGDKIIFYTFFQLYTVKLGLTYHSNLRRYRYGYSRLNDVIEEGLHSFSSRWDCIKFVLINPDLLFRRIKIVKCVIPTYSQYYVGKFQGIKGYASDTLTYNKIQSVIN